MKSKKFLEQVQNEGFIGETDKEELLLELLKNSKNPFECIGKDFQGVKIEGFAVMFDVYDVRDKKTALEATKHPSSFKNIRDQFKNDSRNCPKNT